MDRQTLLGTLHSGREFDILVVGGGVTGCGAALDAASRGLSVALVERDDFAQGTSSKSTKLVHGGVRYLEKAVLGLDREQFALVREGLRERGRLLANAPHLTGAIRLMTPVASWFQAVYVFLGLMLYDLLAGRRSLGRSRLIGRREGERLFPQLDWRGLKAAVLYCDGQVNDARLALALARTANAYGAACLNQVEVVGLVKFGGRVRGAVVRDRRTGEQWALRAKCVLNAAGPFADGLRRLDDPAAAPALAVSSGIHILLDAGFTPPDLALMIPRTEDGRVLFMIPWLGHVLFGTTDEPAAVERDPAPREAEVDYLLRHAARYLGRPLARKDVLAAWSGLRPLVFAPGRGSTQALARSHVVLVSPSGLISILGGKLTSYRAMAEDAVDAACRVAGLSCVGRSTTRALRLVGSREFAPEGWRTLVDAYGLSEAQARSLHALHGDEAAEVLALGRELNLNIPLHPEHPFLKSEVAFAVRRELAVHLSDVLLRRLPLGLLNMAHALQAAPEAARIMAELLGWSAGEEIEELESACALIDAWHRGRPAAAPERRMPAPAPAACQAMAGRPA